MLLLFCIKVGFADFLSAVYFVDIFYISKATSELAALICFPNMAYSHAAAQSDSVFPDAPAENRFPFSTFAFGARSCMFFPELPTGLPPEVTNGTTVFPLKS